MIEATEKTSLQDQLRAIETLTELKTRILLLVEYIHAQERSAADDATEYPHGYNTNIEKVEISASKVLWFLGFGHDEEAVAVFAKAHEEFLRQRAAERKKGEENGEEISKREP